MPANISFPRNQKHEV